MLLKKLTVKNANFEARLKNCENTIQKHIDKGKVRLFGKALGPLEYWLITDWDYPIEILCHEKPA